MARTDNAIDDANNPGSKMRQARQREQITLTRMAELTKLSKGYLSHIENGRVKPTRDILQQYETILGLEPQSLTATFDAESKTVEQPLRQATPRQTGIAWSEMPLAKPALFCGRDEEMRDLADTLRDANKQVITIVGLGGIGKTTLAREIAEQFDRDGTFQFIFWYSLRNVRSVDDLYDQFLDQFQRHMSPSQAQEKGVPDQRARFFSVVHSYSCLLILDNTESLFEDGVQTSHLPKTLREYRDFILAFANENDDGKPIPSKLLLTGRKDITEYVQIQVAQAARFATMSLAGIKDISQGQALVESWNQEQKTPWQGTPDSWRYLITYYGGMPLALLLIAPMIAIDYGGDVDLFVTRYLKTGGAVPGSIRYLLDEHFETLALLEQRVMFWLAIENEAVSLETLAHDFVQPPAREGLQATLTSLRRRLLIESPMTIDTISNQAEKERISARGQYLLQPVIYEYMIAKLVKLAVAELRSALKQAPGYTLPVLTAHALFKAQAEDFVHQNQRDFILRPIATQLLAAFPIGQFGTLFGKVLDNLRADVMHEPGYIAGNIFNLLVFIAQDFPAYHLDMKSFNFSELVLRQISLRAQGRELQGVNLTGATLIDPIFIETIAPIESVAYHPDTRLLAAGMTTGEIRTWKAMAGTPPPTTYEGHSDWVRAVAFHVDGTLLASGSEDKTVRLWEVGTGQCLAIGKNHTDWIWAITFSADGTWIASASEDGTVQVWDVYRRSKQDMLEGTALFPQDHKAPIDPLRSVAFDRAGTMIAAGSSSGNVTIWKYTTNQGSDGRAVFRMTNKVSLASAHQDKVWSVAFSPDGKFLATAGADRAIRVWDTTDGHWIDTFWGHTNSVWSVMFRDADTIVSSSADCTIRFWRIGTSKQQDMQEGFDSRISSAAFTHGATYLATGSVDRTLRLWDVLADRSIWSLQGYTSWVWSVSFHPQSNLLASSNENQTIRIWNLDEPNDSPDSYQELPHEHTNAVYIATYSPDGQMIASGSEDKTVRLWDAILRECVQILRGHNSWISDVKFSPDGRLLASSSGDHTIRLWDRESGECLDTSNGGHEKAVWSIAFSPDSRLLVSGGVDNRVILWDISDPRHITRIDAFVGLGHADWVGTVAFSSDGEHIASGGADKRILLWHINQPKPITSLSGHSDRVRSLAFRGDGKVLASGGSDRTVRLWDTEQGILLQTLRKHSARVRSVSFNHIGERLASGGEDGVIHLWRKDGDTHTYSYEDSRSNSDNRPYSKMVITSIQGLTPTQINALKELGATETA